jgi:alpha-tubulin suppressor-like RCC1 family protein
LWAWGNNGEGQLGDGTTENRTAPVRIMEDVNAVSGGYHTTYAIKEDGSLWAWGYSGQGCNFKYESADNSFVPIKIMEKVIAVSTNGNDAVAIKDDNSLWVWGFDAFYYFYLLDPAKTEEIKIMEGVQKISAGLFHFMALDLNGTVWTFGASNYGELGNGVAGQTLTYKPQRVMDGVVNISAGVDHSLALKEDGSLWAWGRNDFGQLGDGTYENRSRPVKVMDDVAAVSAGSKFTAAIKKDGTLWAWGNNPPRMYAAAHINKCNTPQQVFSDKNQENPVYASAVSGGDNHMLITARDGRLLASGEDNYGQLGDGGGEWFLGSDADEDWNEIHLVEVLMPEG